MCHLSIVFTSSSQWWIWSTHISISCTPIFIFHLISVQSSPWFLFNYFSLNKKLIYPRISCGNIRKRLARGNAVYIRPPLGVTCTMATRTHTHIVVSHCTNHWKNIIITENNLFFVRNPSSLLPAELCTRLDTERFSKGDCNNNYIIYLHASCGWNHSPLVLDANEGIV